MKHNFIWNSVSFFQAEDDTIFFKIESALEGLARIPVGDETAALYFDGKESLLERKISKNLTVQDFVANSDREDLVSLLLELEDKANAIDEIPESQILSLPAFYFSGLGYEVSIDFLAIAAELDGILFSVNSIEYFNNHEIHYATYLDGDSSEKPFAIYSVFDVESGQSISDALHAIVEEVPLTDLLPQCDLSDDFSAWCGDLQLENNNIIRKKLTLARDRGFQGGEPLFKTLSNADGMRELRTRAFSGGAIRILFGSLKKDRIGILVGFIKKSNSDGYDENITQAKTIWAAMKQKSA